MKLHYKCKKVFFLFDLGHHYFALRNEIEENQAVGLNIK